MYGLVRILRMPGRFCPCLLRRVAAGICYITRIKMCRDALVHEFANYPILSSTSCVEASTLLLSFHTACINHAFSSFSIFCFKEGPGRGNLHRWVDDRKKLMSSFEDFRTSSSRKFSEFVPPNNRFRSKDNSSSLCGHGRKARDCSMRRLSGYAPGRSRLFAFHGQGSLTRNPGIAAIASSGECVPASYEVSEHGSKFRGSFASRNSRSATCFIMGSIVCQTPSIERDSMRLPLQRTGFSSRVSHNRS